MKPAVLAQAKVKMKSLSTAFQNGRGFASTDYNVEILKKFLRGEISAGQDLSPKGEGKKQKVVSLCD